MGKPIIRLKDVWKIYKMGEVDVTALKGINLSINKGEFVAITGAIGIANTMFTTVLQKTKEIGIMKAVGAKNRTIMLIFLFNSAMIGLVGGILGGVLGIILSSWVPIMLGAASIMPGRFGLNTLVTPQLVLFVLSFSIFVGITAGVVPAYRASRMNPVDALRYE